MRTRPWAALAAFSFPGRVLERGQIPSPVTKGAFTGRGILSAFGILTARLLFPNILYAIIPSHNKRLWIYLLTHKIAGIWYNLHEALSTTEHSYLLLRQKLVEI